MSKPSAIRQHMQNICDEAIKTALDKAREDKVFVGIEAPDLAVGVAQAVMRHVVMSMKLSGLSAEGAIGAVADTMADIYEIDIAMMRPMSDIDWFEHTLRNKPKDPNAS